ncbi:MAG: hypothetical protein L6R42_003795 [Xanthoria sp. 1 TBL-2021]|nr:MAG: hypothetical protein L6R42_003795 [Xanthoria sp. 1 TBL-2021]
MAHLVTLACCSLNQWALDFSGNARRIKESVVKAKAAGASLRVGPELEITGYGCLDHFLEGDIFLHSWEALATIINDDACQDIVLDIGMPVRHKNVRYNCRIISYNRKIILIRPKMWLANDGNYREMRYFTPWMRPGHVEDYYLESIVGKITGQTEVPFGDGIISTNDTCFACETCEELFTPAAPHGPMGLDGVEIFTNSSGSHFELRKLKTRLDLISCDGERVYYDGSSMIICNGDILACGSQFSLNEVEVVTATIDLESVRSFRSSPSRGLQSQHAQKFPRINLKVRLSKRAEDHDYQIQGQSEPIDLKYHAPEEEIALGGACWLWDYLRRCHAAGFFIPLSGGIDSCATSVMVFSMCRLVVSAIQEGNEQVLQDARRIAAEADDSGWVPTTPQELMNRIFCTTYMGSKNSSSDTRNRAKDLARDIGAYHVDIDIDTVTTAIVNVFFSWSNWMPRFKSAGGSFAENLALQNIQARSRMVLAYLFAQLLPTFRGRRGGGSLLVLGSANVDEALRGYLTKYDFNPIGGISKTDLKAFIDFAHTRFDLPILSTFLSAVPTAELEPITSSYVQSDEADMGITYAELSTFGRLRKNDKLGPWGAYCKLLNTWESQKSTQNPRDQPFSPRQIAEKTKFFFTKYAINRHKMTVLTPSLHMEQYSPDDNRFDLRPFLYPGFDWAYAKIDRDVERREKAESGTQKEKEEDDLD